MEGRAWGAAAVLALAAPSWGAGRDGKFWTDARSRDLHASHSVLGRIAKAAMPAVVSITTVDAVSANPLKGSAPDGPSEPQRGVGSGFIVQADGYILTCAHVVEDAREIHVAILSPQGFPEEYPARVVGADAQTDFALLKVEVERKLPVLALGSAQSVDIADWLVVIGSPFGLAHSVSVGVVSYKGRTEVTPNGRAGYFDYIQTDASINPGNSGGPILDINGDVVAIANAVNVAGQGIGFAVPVDIAKAVMPELREHGQVRRGWAGISVTDLTPELAAPLRMPSYEGVLVSDVVSGSPAARAGIRSGDIITRVTGERIRKAHDIRWKVATAGIGHALAFHLERAGRAFDARVMLTDSPPDVATEMKIQVAAPARHTLGAVVTDVDPATGQKAGLATPFGVLVQNVEPGSPLARAGLASGDVVLKVNTSEVNGRGAFQETLEETTAGDVVRLIVRRGGTTVALGFRKP